MVAYTLFFLGNSDADYRHTGVVHCASDERARINAATLLRGNAHCRAIQVCQGHRDVAWITREDLEHDDSSASKA